MILLKQRSDALVVEHMRAGPVDQPHLEHVNQSTHAMKSDWQTVTENKQMQQSVTLALIFLLGVTWDPPSARVLPLDSAGGVDSAPPSTFSWFKAFVLLSVHVAVTQHRACGDVRTAMQLPDDECSNTHLNSFAALCQSRPSSTRILMARNMSS